MRLKTLATHPVWREPRTVFGVWMLTGVIFAIVKLLIGKYNNYKIFEGVYWHAIEGLTLYGDHYPEYYDSNHYGILFTLNPQLHSRSATYIKRNGLLIRKITIKSSRPFQCAYHPLTP